MSDNTNEQKLSREIDEGLERDLRVALGLEDDNPQEETEDQNMEQEAHAEEQSQDSSPEEASQETEEPSLPDSWEIDGEKVTIDQIREWRKGYLRMDDYTRKTQRLSEREREIRELEQRLQPLIQVERLLASNPHLYQALQQSLQRALMGQAPYTTGAAPLAQRGVPQGPAAQQPSPAFQPLPMGFGVDPVLEQRLSKLEQIEAEQQLDRMLQEVRSKANAERQELGLPALSDEEWQQVSTQLMNEALASKNNDLHMVYRQSPLRDQWYREALLKAREAALQEQREQQRRQASAVMSGSPRGSTPTPSVSEPPKDFAEATRRAAAELRQLGLSLYSE